MGLGLGIGSMMSGSASAAVVIEDYLWSGTSYSGEGEDIVCEITPRFANVTAVNVQDFNDAWDIGVVGDSTGGDAGGGMFKIATTNEMMPATDPNPNYFSDDEGYWVVTTTGNAIMTRDEDYLVGQDGTASTELTPIHCDGGTSNFPIGDGNYV